MAIDFDGTIHDVNNPVPGRKMGPPIEEAKEALTQLKTEGHKLIIHTIWATDEKNIKTIQDWFTYWEIPFDEITNIKPQADYYIDDKAIKFIDWPSTLKSIK
ncbi:MAG: hypothetical protein M3362_00230 [Acidobacteriota bacterium]|nr:hypothetical protein [Acidobacteriota bacterium]